MTTALGRLGLLLLLATAAYGPRAKAAPQLDPPPSGADIAGFRVSIPPHDFRRVSLPGLEAGDTITVRFRVVTPAKRLELEILHREGADEGKPQYEPVASFPATESLVVRHRIRQPGDYVAVLRQPLGSTQSVEADFTARVETAETVAKRTPVRVLSPRRRIAVAVFSMGLLWTTLILCGAPLLRAFRSRRRREEPPWFG